MTQPLISMSQKELSKYEIITNLIGGLMNGTQAARQLNLTVRHIKRLKKKVKEHGPISLIHGNRGKPSNRRITPEVIARAKTCLKKHYHDFKPTFASEKLKENHQITLSSETVRTIMTDLELWKPKPRKENGEYRIWRPRKEYYGEMEQFDGSYHRWFEDRAPGCCLLAAVDDATGQITRARFAHDEGVKPVLGFWRGYLDKQGKPVSVYLDRYSTYKINAKHLFDDPEVLTQFERAMKDLDISVIHAHSPQAKGRIERLFGTLQDRLVKELRLAGISTMREANIFLGETFIPEFNRRFSVVPEKKGNLHKKLTRTEDNRLDGIFSIQENKTVNNDFTVRYDKKWYQLDKVQPTLVCRKDKVLMEERLDNTIRISLRGKYLNCIELPERPKKVIDMKVIALSTNKPEWKPPLNHPWRKNFIINPERRHQESKVLERIA